MKTGNWYRGKYSIVRCLCMLYKVESDLPCMNRISTTPLYVSIEISSCTLSWKSMGCLLTFPYEACFIYSDAECFRYFDVHVAGFNIKKKNDNFFNVLLLKLLIDKHIF